MSDQGASEGWRAFRTTAPLKACRLPRDDLRRLYEIINERQVEYGKTVLAQLTCQPNESDEQFRERRARVERAFLTTVTVTGVNGEMVTGLGEEFLASANVPDRILTAFYSTATGPTVALPGFQPQSNATVLIDFSRPPVFDFSKFPILATPNTSQFTVSSNSESWFTALNTRLTQFFAERRTSYEWLHKPGIYDLLLLVVAIPIALWVDYRIARSSITNRLPSFLASAVYVYGFLIALFVYRLLFSYSRWVFPKVEMPTEGSTALKHRTVWGAIIVGAASLVLWDAIKALW